MRPADETLLAMEKVFIKNSSEWVGCRRGEERKRGGKGRGRGVKERTGERGETQFNLYQMQEHGC